MPTLYFLIGLPCSGKSTWVNNRNIADNSAIIASTDVHIEKYAASINKTYQEVYYDVIKLSTKMMKESIRYAIDNDMDIYWDQTNLSPTARGKKLRSIPNNYKKIAVVFVIDDDIEYSARLANRIEKPISDHILTKMKLYFQMPTLAEGFDEIITIKDHQ